jgi:hypothetical protein
VVFAGVTGARGDVPCAMRWLAGLLQEGNRLRVSGSGGGQGGDCGCEVLELGHHSARHDGVGGCVEVLGGKRGRGGWPGIKYQDVMSPVWQQWWRRR